MIEMRRLKNVVIFVQTYLQCKSTFLDDKIGLSKFAELRLKWCRTVGQSGSHVCVCTYHQNVKLILSAVIQH